MKSLIKFFFLFTYLSHVTFGQFKEVAGGFAHASQATISAIGYAKAKGGVVLKKESQPMDDALMVYQSVRFSQIDDEYSAIHFTTNECEVSLISKKWILQDAAKLVDSEGSSDLVRDINLHGTPSDNEDTLTYSRDEYWYVEMNQNLIGTKAGEVLLLVDLLQTDVSFYSDNANGVYTYQRHYDSLMVMNFNQTKAIILNPDQYSLSGLDTLRVQSFMYTAALYGDEVPDDITFFYDVSPFIGPTDWTYNDEEMRFYHECNCETGKLDIIGLPHFTFISFDYVDETYTDFFKENPKFIYDLRYETMAEATLFSRVSSFFRYLKSNQVIWSNVRNELLSWGSSSGNTPRIIKK